MKRDKLEQYLGTEVAVTLFDHSVYEGTLRKTASEEYKDDPNLYIPKNSYFLTDDNGDVCSCIFKCSHVTKLNEKKKLCGMCIHKDVCGRHICLYSPMSKFVELPCDLGDTVYFIPTYNGLPYCGVCTDQVRRICISTKGISLALRKERSFNKTYMLGKRAFLSYKEAVNELKRMEECFDA